MCLCRLSQVQNPVKIAWNEVKTNINLVSSQCLVLMLGLRKNILCDEVDFDYFTKLCDSIQM